MAGSVTVLNEVVLTIPVGNEIMQHYVIERSRLDVLAQTLTAL